MEPGWLIIGLSAGRESIVREVAESQALRELLGMAARDIDAIAVLNPATRTALGEGIPEFGGCGLTVLLPCQRSPVLGLQYDRYDVQSFCCAAPIAREILGREGDGGISVFCFHLLEEVAQGRQVLKSLSVRQVGRLRPNLPIAFDAHAYTVVMAHRGQARHLRAALSHIGTIRGTGGKIMVGLDIDDADLASNEDVAAAFPQVEFFRISPSPAGPYVVRSKLLKQVTDPLILFHDSDDLSCSDRAEKLTAALEENGVGMVGSQELRLDELSKRVVAVRYPLDVNGALGIGPALAQLHPSTVIRRELYERIGGFSTHVIFSGDTQLLLRAFFHTKVRNVDEFLYIRRKHPDALTVRPDTGNGTPARIRTEAPWWADFARVKAGMRKLEESSLRRFDSQTTYELERVFQHVSQ